MDGEQGDGEREGSAKDEVGERADGPQHDSQGEKTASKAVAKDRAEMSGQRFP